MKLNNLLDSLSGQMQHPEFLSSVQDARGFLVHTDPRMEFLLMRTGKSEYHHNAMPLLQVTFKDSFMFILDLGRETLELQAGKFILNQDSIWLLERKSSLADAVKVPLKNVLKLDIRIPGDKHLQRGRVSDFLERI